MIDNNADRYSKFQLEMITKLLIKLKSIDSLGRVSILVNANHGYDTAIMSNKYLSMPLHLLAYNTSSIELATCRLAWYNYSKLIPLNLKHTPID